MSLSPEIRRTVNTVAIGACGALLAWALSVPAAILIGPAVTVSAAALTGQRVAIADPLRDACFVVLGLGIGAGFTTDAGAAIQRWPFAFAVLALTLAVTLVLCRLLLERAFGFDRQSAVLAAAPGHLSFVLGLAHETGADAPRIAVVQTVRLLALTVSVPFAALALGYQIEPAMLPRTTPMALPVLAVLAIGGVLVGRVLRRVALPAPLLLGPMALSALTHVTGLIEGGLPDWLMIPAFAVMGALIGTRFAGLDLNRFRRALWAGLATTGVAVLLASATAIPVAATLGMPPAHVIAAFAPGGLETMIALGAAMGASPGFVAACHMVRLMILSVLIPLALGRRRSV